MFSYGLDVIFDFSQNTNSWSQYYISLLFVYTCVAWKSLQTFKRITWQELITNSPPNVLAILKPLHLL